MIPGHFSFKAEIKKLKFETDAGIRFPCTALIQFKVADREKPVVELMGYMDEEEIYKAIDRGDALNLDNCYIEKFSFVYYLLILNSSADIIASVDDQLTVLARSFYHSAITFLTIGYGDHYPFGSIRWVSSFEGFCGLFLMSYFTVAFVRKVLR